MKTYIILLVTVFFLLACHKENEKSQDCCTPPTFDIRISKENILIKDFLTDMGEVDREHISSFLNPEKPLLTEGYFMDKEKQTLCISCQTFETVYTNKKEVLYVKNKKHTYKIEIIGEMIPTRTCSSVSIKSVWVDGKSISKENIFYNGYLGGIYLIK